MACNFLGGEDFVEALGLPVSRYRLAAYFIGPRIRNSYIIFLGDSRL